MRLSNELSRYLIDADGKQCGTKVFFRPKEIGARFQDNPFWWENWFAGSLVRQASPFRVYFLCAKKSSFASLLFVISSVFLRLFVSFFPIRRLDVVVVVVVVAVVVVVFFKNLQKRIATYLDVCSTAPRNAERGFRRLWSHTGHEFVRPSKSFTTNTAGTKPANQPLG